MTPIRSGGRMLVEPGTVDDVPPDGEVFFFTPGVLPNCP
jgi:hypothetical protein